MRLGLRLIVGHLESGSAAEPHHPPDKIPHSFPTFSFSPSFPSSPPASWITTIPKLLLLLLSCSSTALLLIQKSNSTTRWSCLRRCCFGRDPIRGLTLTKAKRFKCRYKITTEPPTCKRLPCSRPHRLSRHLFAGHPHHRTRRWSRQFDCLTGSLRAVMVTPIAQCFSSLTEHTNVRQSKYASLTKNEDQHNVLVWTLSKENHHKNATFHRASSPIHALTTPLFTE